MYPFPAIGSILLSLLILFLSSLLIPNSIHFTSSIVHSTHPTISKNILTVEHIQYFNCHYKSLFVNSCHFQIQLTHILFLRILSMKSIKRLFQSLLTNISPITNTSEIVPSCHDTFLTLPSIGSSYDEEILNKIDRMARQPQSNPFEYMSLTPTQRLMYIVKKTEYYPYLKPRTKQIVRKNKPKQATFPPLFPSRSPVWPQPRLTRPISKRSIVRSNIPSMGRRTRLVALNHGSVIANERDNMEDNEQTQPCQGLKRPRPAPAHGALSRSAKRFRYTDIEPVRGTKRSRSNNVAHSIPPVAKKLRSVRVSNRSHETVKQEIRAERWNHRHTYGNVSARKLRHDLPTITALCRGRGVFE